MEKTKKKELQLELFNMAKKTHKNWNTKEIRRMIQLRKDRFSIKDISIILDRPFWSVAKKLAEHKMYLPGRSRIIDNTYRKNT